MYDQYTGGSLVGIMQNHHPHHTQQQQQQQHQQHQQQQQQQAQHHLPHHQQHPPHPHQQQQHQPFMSSPEQWLPEDGQDEFMPKIVQRRAKRVIPDTEKDDKYWEKRKRNNMAAKRSRENKRLLENDIRQKVCSLEEQNALLRKEVALIKNRYGIPLDQSFLTPEERAQCMQEVKNAQEERNALNQQAEKTGSPDGVSSTSSSVYPVCLHQVSEDDEQDRKGGSDGTNPSPKLKEEDLGNGGSSGRRGGGDNGYGPSAYGPFNPSPCWGPAGSSSNDMHGYGTNSGVADNGANANNVSFSPPIGTHTKLPPISNAFHEKPNSPYGRYVNNSIGVYGRPPYDYFMQYASGQQNSMLYGNEDDVAQSGIAPADLSTSRNTKSRQDDRRIAMRNIMVTKNSDISDSMMHSIPNTVPGSVDLDDVSVMNSSMGQQHIPRSQDHFVPIRSAGMPVQQSSSSGHGQSLPTETAHTANNPSIGGPEQEHLKRENDALKMAVRTLTAQVEHMKDQVYKD